MKRIKVAFFADILTGDFDGAVRTMYQLINRIDKTRFDYLFIYGAGPDEIEGFQSLKVPSVVLPINTNYTIALPVLAQTRLKRSLNDFGADVVHISTPSLLGNFGLQYAAGNYLPVISIYHTHFLSYIDYYLRHTPFLVKKVRHRMEDSHKTFYNQCDKVYVASESIKGALLGIGIDDYRMRIWKRGIDTSLFSPQKRDTSLMRRLTGNHNPTILFASRLVWEKNLQTLFAVYLLTQKRSLSVNFVIAGDGIARKACEENMPNAVFLGKVDHEQLSVLYASADVFLFPSDSEAYGNVVVEAMASGLPCVIANGGGSADFIEQGINGFKCNPYNANEFADKLQLVLTSAPLRKLFIKNGIQYCKNLSWDSLAAEYFEDINTLAAQPVLQLAAN